MTIKDRIIALLLRLGLGFIRVLVFLKPKILILLDWLLLPARILWALLLSLGVPVYRVLYMLKKQAGDAYRPAKNRIMYVIANRHTVHVMVGFVLLIAFGFNLHTSTVRAEAFGEQTLMYAIVANEGERFTEEEVVLESVADRPPVAYFDAPLLEAPTYGLVAEDGMDSGLFASSSGVEAPPIIQGEDSVAPRETVITYAAQEGDTLSEVANKFGISLNTLLWANNLTVRSSIRVGKELTILPTSGVVHTVGKGDTLTKIASRYNAKSEDIVAFNKLGADEALTVGSKVIVPGGEIKAVVSAPSAVGRVFAAPTSNGTPGAGGGSASGNGSMVWPTDLRVITQYFGWKHTGIDIDCHFTNDNYAADAGTVIYSGWKSGYGYAVEVDHGNGIITRYGHHASLYVSKGDSVAQGQAVGRCGTTGKSTGTHLHFEVIIGGKYKNPLEYIR